MNTNSRIFYAIFFSVLQIWKHQKMYLIILISINIIMGLVPVVLVWTTQQLVNSVTNIIVKRSSLREAILYFSIQIIILIISNIIGHVTDLNDQKSKNTLGKIIYKNILFKIKKIPFIFFETPEIHNKIQRISGKQDVFNLITNEFLKFIKNIISISAIIAFLIHIHWFFVIIISIGIFPLLIIEFLFGRKNYELNKFLTPFSRKENYLSFLLTNRDSLKEIKLYSLMDYMTEKWEYFYDKNAESQYILLRKRTIWIFGAEFFNLLTYTGSFLLVLFLLYKGNLYVGSYVAIINSVQNIQSLLQSLGVNISNIYENSLYINDYIDFIEFEPSTTPINDKKVIINRINLIQLKNVSFQYPNHDKPSITNINLEIPIGKNIAIIGENGSGKTTLTKCITGLYEVTSGEIIVNNKKLDQIDKLSYQKKISVLFQDYIKYMFSVKENIGFGDYTNLNDFNRIEKAARATGIHEEIEKMPYQYETELGNMFSIGSQLSGGEWQKLALSRAIFRNSDVIILDEPTSSLDPISEINILRHLYSNSKGKSIICITHRIGPTLLSDEIIIMKDGKIVERGSHEELIQLHGIYFTLFKTQEKWYQKKEEIQI